MPHHPKDKDHASKKDETHEKEEVHPEAEETLAHLSHEELQKRIADAKQKMHEQQDQILRMQADSKNAARRLERDVESAHKYGLEKFANELLPIVDSLELCVEKRPESEEWQAAAKPVIDGVELTLKMFYAAMGKFGVKQVDPIGKPFNPDFHQAIATQYDPMSKPGTVISVLQKGYTLNDRLIRPALVTVAKAKD